MANKTTEMKKVKEMLILHQQGYSNRRIAEMLSTDKETVNNYVRQAKADRMNIKELVSLEEPVLAGHFNDGVGSYPDVRYEDFKTWLPYLKEQMQIRHVTLKLLWEEYRSKHPQGYSLTQFREHYRRHVKSHKATAILRDLYVPGEKLFIDFAGDLLYYVDTESGEKIPAPVFVATLGWSDYCYVQALKSQKSEEVICALSCCLKHIGGSPAIIVPDNMKTAVIKTDPYNPVINTIMEDFALHYGAVVVPARAGKPRDKSLVENEVKLTYQRIFAPLRNRQYHSLEALNEDIYEQTLLHNRKRMHQSQYSREELFISQEKPLLKPLPEHDFEIINRARLKVHLNGAILLSADANYYSVPYQYIGQQVEVHYTRTLVRIYSSEHECIALHQRNRKIKYVFKQEHLASNVKAYREYSPERFIRQGYNALKELGEVIELMFATSKTPPETFYKGCQGLLHLQRRTPADVFLSACQMALQYRVYRYAFINNIIQSHCAGIRPTEINIYPPAPSQHANLRDRKEFS